MGWLSSLFKPKFRSIQEAERALFPWYYVGFVTTGIGLVLMFTLVLSPVGLTVIAIGGVIILLATIWLVLASKRSTITKNCPRCGRPNSIFQGEAYFKCISCGYFAILQGR